MGADEKPNPSNLTFGFVLDVLIYRLIHIEILDLNLDFRAHILELNAVGSLVPEFNFTGPSIIVRRHEKRGRGGM